MESKLGDVVIKMLNDNIQTRKIIKCDDFFDLVHYMGFDDDGDEIIDIINYLEDNNIDINFHNAKAKDYYNRYKNIERRVQLSKMLKGTKTEVQRMIEKVDKIKVQDRPDWLEFYKDDDYDDEINIRITSDRDMNLGKDIIDRLTNEIKKQVENEPQITLEEIENEIRNNN
jgi:hypothetical protein